MEEVIIRRAFPVGVKIISSIIYFISGILIILAAYLLISSIVIYLTGSANQIFYSFIGYTNIKGFILQGSLELVLGIFGFVLARGLWKAKNQARMTTIWSTILVIIFCEFYFGKLFFSNGSTMDYLLFSILPGFLVLVVLGIICLYLLYSRKVKRTFLRN